MISERNEGRRVRRDERAGISSGASAVRRGWDAEPRRQHAPNLVEIPCVHRVEKRLCISLEQLLALLCILGLAGRLRLKDAGLGKSSE